MRGRGEIFGDALAGAQVLYNGSAGGAGVCDDSEPDVVASLDRNAAGEIVVGLGEPLIPS